MLSMALLALVWSSDGSTEGLMLLLLKTAAIREMLAGMSFREPSASSMLAWDDVSTGGTVTCDFGGGDVVTATVVIFFREDCLDSQLDASVITWSRRCLTSAVILSSSFGGDLCGLVVWMMEALPIDSALVSDSTLGGISISR